MEKKLSGSNLPIDTAAFTVDATEVKTTGQQETSVHAESISDASNFVIWRGNGNISLNVNCAAINAASNVMVSISEYGNTANPAGSRFMGAARFAVNNIAPRNGGVVVNMEITWATPLNIYMSLLIS